VTKLFLFNRVNQFSTKPDRSQVIALAPVLAQFRGKIVAEGVGFEPTRACALPVFKTGAINHSTTPPRLTGAIDLNRHGPAAAGVNRRYLYVPKQVCHR
jgi:hypothetical protein